MDCVIELVNRHADAVERREEALQVAREKDRARRWKRGKMLRVTVISNEDFLAAVGLVCITAVLMWLAGLCL